MTISIKAAKLAAVLAAFVSVAGAAAPASADAFRADFYSGQPYQSVSVHYGDRDSQRFDRLRFEQRRAMMWREMEWKRHHHFVEHRADGHVGYHYGFER